MSAHSYFSQLEKNETAPEARTEELLESILAHEHLILEYLDGIDEKVFGLFLILGYVPIQNPDGSWVAGLIEGKTA